MKKLGNTVAELKKSVAYKKACVSSVRERKKEKEKELIFHAERKKHRSDG